ncbi:MAG: FtsX-like permease family protein [candidate division Zixibacteria bacterium]|nr:FtsX-like permease family protein [candidate division Zixibacteria bacterium]
MIWNYLKIALRQLVKYKSYSVINITGLAVGIACCILIFLWIEDELSYDGFHQNKDQIYRVIMNEEFSGQSRRIWKTPAPLAPALKNDFPEIINSCQFASLGTRLIQTGNKSILQENIVLSDPALFEMFTFPFIRGNPSTALTEPNSVVITKSTAQKFYGESDPIGEIIKVDERLEFNITGVIEDTPSNSHLQFECIMPFKMLDDFNMQYLPMLEDWSVNAWTTYVMIDRIASKASVENKISDYLKVHKGEDALTVLTIQKLNDIYLRSKSIEPIQEEHGDIRYVYIFSCLAILILIIACINFINLTTAKSSIRAREIGVRKVIGAHRRDLILQFIGESFLLSLAALLCAIVIVELFLPFFNDIAGKTINLNFLNNLNALAIVIGIALLTGIIAGLYPAIVLSSFGPVTALSGALHIGKSRISFRRVLVIIQLAASIILIFSSTIIIKQLEFINNKDLGFDKEQLIYLKMRGDTAKHYETMKSSLLEDPRIVSAGASSSLPTNGIAFSTPGVNWEGKEPEDEVVFNYISVSKDYLKTMGIGMVEGEFFSGDSETEQSMIVINEAAAELIGFESPVGMQIESVSNQATILGVISNFHFESIHVGIKPLFLINQPQLLRYIIIRTQTDNYPELLADIENVWNDFAPSYPFVYHFLDQSIERLYRSEQCMSSLFTSFTLFGLFISCMGLLGLVAYVTERRTKEIGIRKVLGASVSTLIVLLTREFVEWVLFANAIALPVAYILMIKWLSNFAYHIEISWLIFIMSGTLVLVVTLLTVCFQAVRAAISNPVNSLRYE